MSKDIVVYTSSAGGMLIPKQTSSLLTIIKAYTHADPKVVYLDIEDTEFRKSIWEKSGKRGIYPLLFVDGEFIGDYDTVVGLNEAELLKPKLL